MDRATIYKIAERAGVSTATVSRALSGKDSVRPETRQRILDAAEELNYRPSCLARRLSGPDITIAVFSAGQQFDDFDIDIFRGAYDACRELSEYRVNVRLCYFPLAQGRTWTEEDFEALIAILESGIQGVIALPRFSDKERDRRVQEILKRNRIVQTGVVCSARPQDNMFSYLSDTYTAGTLAAELMWNILGDGSKVSVFTCEKDKPGHAEEICGFRDALEQYPLELLTIYENYDDPQMAYHATDALLRNYPQVQGIFVTSANSRMVCRRIAEEQTRDICLITSDIYPELMPYIRSGLVRATIVQDQYQQAYTAFRTLTNYLITHIPPENPLCMARPQIVLRSNAHQFLRDGNDKTEEACRAIMEYCGTGVPK